MTSPANAYLATKWINAFNDKDIETLIDLYHDGAEHYNPKLTISHLDSNTSVKGKENLRQWFEDTFTKIPSITYEASTLTADDHRVIVEYIRLADDDQDSYRVAEVFEIKEGKILASRVYNG